MFFFVGENIVPAYLKKLPLYHTSACFERRVRKELEAAGLLDTHEVPKVYLCAIL